MKNHEVESLEDYLLVDPKHGVSELRRKISLNPGDTLELYLGHFAGQKMFNRGLGQSITQYQLEDIRFCIF